MNTFFNFLFQFIDGFIPENDRNGSEDSLRKGRIIYLSLLLIIINDLAFGLLGIFQGDVYLPEIVLMIGIILCLIPAITKFNGSMKFVALYISILCTLMVVRVGLLSGGLHASSFAWFGALAVFILVTLGTPAALMWTSSLLVGNLVLWWFTMHGHVLPDYENPSSKLISWAIAFPSGIFFIPLDAA